MGQNSKMKKKPRPMAEALRRSQMQARVEDRIFYSAASQWFCNGSVYTEPSEIHEDGSVIVLYGSVNTEHVPYTEPAGSTASSNQNIWFGLLNKSTLEGFGIWLRPFSKKKKTTWN